MSLEPTPYDLLVKDIGSVPITATSQGEGRAYLLLHGGAGPQSVSEFGELLAEDGRARVVTPTHPGFGSTPRPETVTNVTSLAKVHLELLTQLRLNDVTVIGYSFGGWVAAEMALLDSPRMSRMILVDAVGIEVQDHPIADFFSLTLPEVAQLSYHDPDAFRIDPATMSHDQRQTMASNRTALAIYGGGAMSDPTLRSRLATINLPTLVVWGDSDRIVDPGYGRAYADAIPGASFRLLHATGHVPQIETPAQLLAAITDFARAKTDVPPR